MSNNNFNEDHDVRASSLYTEFTDPETNIIEITTEALMFSMPISSAVFQRFKIPFSSYGSSTALRNGRTRIGGPGMMKQKPVPPTFSQLMELAVIMQIAKRAKRPKELRLVLLMPQFSGRSNMARLMHHASRKYQFITQTDVHGKLRRA